MLIKLVSNLSKVKPIGSNHLGLADCFPIFRKQNELVQTTYHLLERRKFSDRKDQGFKGESMRKPNLPAQPCKESLRWFPE